MLYGWLWCTKKPMPYLIISNLWYYTSWHCLFHASLCTTLTNISCACLCLEPWWLEMLIISYRMICQLKVRPSTEGWLVISIYTSWICTPARLILWIRCCNINTSLQDIMQSNLQSLYQCSKIIPSTTTVSCIILVEDSYPIYITTR